MWIGNQFFFSEIRIAHPSHSMRAVIILENSAMSAKID